MDSMAPYQLRWATGNVTIYVSEGTDSLLFVLVDEDQDAVHRGAILESAHGAGSSPDLAEPALDSVGGPDLPVSIGVLETGQQIVEIVAQACDSLLGYASSQRLRLAALSALARR